MRNDKIDIVYLWVDGADKKWRAEKDKWYEIVNGEKPLYSGAADDERFRDNGELLYSFRSIAECAPWVNHIYIITGFNQFPKWLNTKHPKITIIPHEQIMPADALPTFNATAIEMCIPNIPNLSEHFLLFNDDMFLNKKLSPSFFYDSRGRAIFKYSKNAYDSSVSFEKWRSTLDGYTQTLALSAKYIDDIFGIKMYNKRPSHGIDPYIKSSWIECRNNPVLKKQIENQIRNKFRTNDEIQRWTMNMYDFATGRAIFQHARAAKYGHRHKISNLIYNIIHFRTVRNSNVVCTDAMLAKSAIKHAAMFCINDSPENGKEILHKNTEFLKQRFPNKCEFEI
ncbi:MAG: Stealth CR1 domain-containing protein [Alphaproteobacteria bacterium]|nr:Stealth CR1 domain-containing protein [Alphaproteobacteria bacterium]